MDWYILFAFMVAVVQVNGSAFSGLDPLADVTSVTISADTSETSGSDPAEYLYNSFDMEVTVNFTAYTSGMSSPSALIVRLQMAGTASSYQNCRIDATLESGQSITDGCTTTQHYQVNAELDGDIYVEVGSAVSTSDTGMVIPHTSALYTEGYIDIYISDISLTPSAASNEYYVTVTYNDMMITAIDTYQLFNASALLYALNTSGDSDLYSTTESDDVKIYFVGPVLGVSFSFNTTSDVQAGDYLEITVDVDHQSASTEDAASLSIEVESESFFPQVGSASWTKTSPSDSGTFSSVPKTISIGAFSQSSTFTTTFVVQATDDMLLNSYAGANVHLSYSSSSSGVAFSENFHDDIQTAMLNLTDNPLDVQFPSTLAPGDTVTLTKYFTMPYGTLEMSFFAEMISDTQSTIPLTVSSTSMSVPAYVTQLSRRRRRDASAGSGAVHSRRKRAINSDSLTSAFDPIVNPSSTGQLDAPVSASVQLSVGTFDAGATDFSLLIGGEFDGLDKTWQYVTVSLYNPQLTINKTVYMVDDLALPNVVMFEVMVEHSGLTNDTAYDVQLTEGDAEWAIDWGSVTTDPSILVSSLTISGDSSLWTWSKTTFTTSDYMSATFESKPLDQGENLPDGISYHYASVTYKPTAASSYELVATTYVCIEKDPIYVDDIFYDYGFTAMTFIFAFILGVLIVIIILIICIKVCRRVPFMPKQSSHGGISDAKIVAVSGGSGVVMTSVQVKQMSQISRRTGSEAVKTIVQVGVSDSIVKILANRNHSQVNQQLDGLDIINSTVVDENIEDERNDAVVTATCTLLQNMEKNGDLNSNTVKNCQNKLKRAASDLDKKLDSDYKNDVAEIYAALSKKNKGKMTVLLEKQEQRRQEMEEKMQNATPEMKAEIMDGLRQEQDAERDELNNILKLEQTEKIEELRKEYSVRKRIGLEEAQQDVLANAKAEGKLSAEQADWLMQEHIKQQVEVKRLYGDELSRQRMILNEKLERRKLLAQKQEIQHNYNEQLIEAAEKQEEDAILKMKKNGDLDEATANIMIAEAKESMKNTKNRLDRDMERQAEDLHKKLSDRKKKRLEEQAKKQKADLDALEKKQQGVLSSESYVDPLSLVEEKQNLVSNQRAEMAILENEIDDEHAAELDTLYVNANEQTKAEVEKEKQNVLKKLESKGLDEDQMHKLLNKHEKDVAKLEKERERQREEQDEKFKETLEKRRREWAAKKERESKEAEVLREQEEQIVRKLIDNQVSMGEEERDKIMKEHEKAQLKMESNLALSRIQQRRMLEEKMAQKRARKMEEIQRSQQTEARKHAKKVDDDSDLDEDEKQLRDFELMKKQQEERKKAIKQENVRIADEMDEVEDELLKERDNAMKEQEVRLAAMLADLQMAKAKEMSRIEEQQRAIHNLKSNIMDDLNEKGILSDPECQKVIEIHQQEQDRLAEKLETQRAKQEKALRKRMAARLKQKESNLQQMHDQQLEQAGSKDALTPAAKIRRMALLSKHQQEMTKFRNRIEKEITQSIAELRRQNDLRRIQYLQDQEIQFINGLVRLGKFKLSELESVVSMLFPNKPEEERRKLLDELCEGYKPKPGKNLRVSSLVERVKWTRLAFPMKSEDSTAGGRRGKKGMKKKKKSLIPNYEDPDYSQRPEPLGRSVSPDYDSDRENTRRPPPTRLAPLEPMKKKKKKKKQQLIDEEDAF